MTLKLGKLPDRETAKITFVAHPQLKQNLDLYAKLYADVHGQEESLAELIPYMLETFMNADPAFKRARKARL